MNEDNVVIPIHKLLDLKIDLSFSLFLYLKHLGKSELANLVIRRYLARFEGGCSIRTELELLQTRGFLKIIGEIGDSPSEAIALREFVVSHFGQDSKSNETYADFIVRYRSLFPIKFKGDRIGVFKKMEAFSKDYPEYTREDIIRATEKYLARLKRSGYRYLRQAHYFIRKDSVSDLAHYCELVKDSTDDYDPLSGGIPEKGI